MQLHVEAASSVLLLVLLHCTKFACNLSAILQINAVGNLVEDGLCAHHRFDLANISSYANAVPNTE